MKMSAIALATVATIAAISVPAEARGGRNAAAIGFGIAAGALAAGAAANSYNSYNSYNGPYYGGYAYDEPYYENNYYYGRPSSRAHRNNQPNPVDTNPYSPW